MSIVGDTHVVFKGQISIGIPEVMAFLAAHSGSGKWVELQFDKDQNLTTVYGDVSIIDKLTKLLIELGYEKN